MLITIVSDTWLPQINGVVTTLTKLKENLNLRGHIVRMVTPDAFVNVGCPTYNEIRLALFPRNHIKKLLKHSDVIHIATEGPLGHAARSVCKKQGWSFTTAFHTKLPEYINQRCSLIPTKTIYKYLKKFHKPSQAVMVPTQSVKKELKQRGFDNTVLWGRGVDLSLFKPNKDLVSTKERIHLYVGRVAIEKNLTAFLDLKLDGIKLVVGDGPDLTGCKKRYPDTQFVGFKTGKELASFYQKANVFVFPSISETFGLVQLEALACGTPVAAYPVPGPLDIITSGVNGCLDLNLEKAIEKCYTIDRNICAASVQKFSWISCTNKFLEYVVPV